jgi:hypothetical protein
MPPQLNVNDVIQLVIMYIVVATVAIIIPITIVSIVLLRKKA